MRLAMKNDEARRKLIRAAGQVFAEVGYDAATVRQITDRAEVNVASINYYFGDKLHLYREVLSDTFSQRTDLLGQRCSKGSPKERLHHFIEWMVAEEKDEARPWHRILVVREISDSSSSRSPELLVELIRPNHRILSSILNDLTRHSLTKTELEILTQMVAALCVHWLDRSAFIQKLSPELTFSSEQTKSLVEQIHQFALGGVSSFLRQARLSRAYKVGTGERRSRMPGSIDRKTVPVTRKVLR
jgi:TetR/AcrR family transcriptional regulator, regulator of cefoperazone and chloramphenicol sensitivity